MNTQLPIIPDKDMTVFISFRYFLFSNNTRCKLKSGSWQLSGTYSIVLAAHSPIRCNFYVIYSRIQCDFYVTQLQLTPALKRLALSPCYCLSCKAGQVGQRFIYADSMGPSQSIYCLVGGQFGLCLVLRNLSHFSLTYHLHVWGPSGPRPGLGASLLNMSAFLCNPGFSSRQLPDFCAGEGMARFTFIHTCQGPALTLSQSSGRNIFCCRFLAVCLFAQLDRMSFCISNYISFSIYYIAFA